MEECAVNDAVDAFAGWHPAVTEMVAGTEVGARWGLHDLAHLERWHTDRVVLMGDAAHTMVPHQGQGANKTIEDAIALADCLAAHQPARSPGVVRELARAEPVRRRGAPTARRRCTATETHPTGTSSASRRWGPWRSRRPAA